MTFVEDEQYPYKKRGIARLIHYRLIPHSLIVTMRNAGKFITELIVLRIGQRTGQRLVIKLLTV